MCFFKHDMVKLIYLRFKSCPNDKKKTHFIKHGANANHRKGKLFTEPLTKRRNTNIQKKFEIQGKTYLDGATINKLNRADPFTHMSKGTILTHQLKNLFFFYFGIFLVLTFSIFYALSRKILIIIHHHETH